jgi:hypothetical protein
MSMVMADEKRSHISLTCTDRGNSGKGTLRGLIRTIKRHWLGLLMKGELCDLFKCLSLWGLGGGSARLAFPVGALLLEVVFKLASHASKSPERWNTLNLVYY